MKPGYRRKTWVPGYRRVNGRMMYSAAWLNDPASTSVRHARLKEVWATCYCMVLALSRIVRAHAGSAIRQFFTWSGVLFWILMAIFTYGHLWGR